MRLQLQDPQTQLLRNEAGLDSSSDSRCPRFDGQCPIADSQSDKKEQVNMSRQSYNPQSSAFLHDPYVGLPIIGTGMTGIIFQLGADRAVKKAKQYEPQPLQDREDTEYVNGMNQQILENEIQVFERLGRYKGIISCFRTSQYGIELALAQGDLESYLETYPEREDSLKIAWMSSLIETFSYVHSCKIFVDAIALRNILIMDEQLKLADFGQSILLPLDIDITSAKENDMNAQIEILHLGWILYSISSWHVHKYHFFGPENPDLCWPDADSLPNVDDVLFGRIIRKCWRGEYASMDQWKEEAHQFLTSYETK
ncbi:hypothetical protein MAP00_004299 [Monascus purpureus]|nr:hypothetical protein MAP00_004299 [Monascus purpureus]